MRRNLSNINELCQDLAKILKGEAKTKKNVCTINQDRKDLNVKILGVQISFGNEFVFHQIDGSVKTLILGEVVLLENEVPYVENSLTNQGITVSAIHNHWLYDQPHLIYMHFEAIMTPHEFADKINHILQFEER